MNKNNSSLDYNISALNQIKLKQKALKKQLSSLTTTSSSIKTNRNNLNNKKIISLFIDNNPFHYKLPLNNYSTNTFEIFSDRKYKQKKLMDSIENYIQETNINSFDYNNCISNLMTKYLYSNPDADTTITPRYEITKSKIDFYKKNKTIIENYLTKSKSSNKFNLKNLKKKSKLGYDEENNSTKVRFKNMKYKDPVDSLGLLLRNKIVHDKILLNYQDKEVQNFGKKLNILKNLNKFEKYKNKVKITQIMPIIKEKDLFNYKKKDHLMKMKIIKINLILIKKF